MRDDKIYTAGELAGDWWWVDAGYGCKPAASRKPVVWETATLYGDWYTVRLERVVEIAPLQLQIRRNYVGIDYPMRLVKREQTREG